jgi:1,4-alpha-glucan branching enzyme
LFGHWWFEGPDFLDAVARLAVSARLRLFSPSDYLRESPRHQLAAPCASSWGEEGYWRVWLDETNAWMYPPLLEASEEMERLMNQHRDAPGLAGRALRLAGQELMHLQASDWPFILRAGTHAAYARQRIADHLERFRQLAQQLDQGQFDEERIGDWERRDLIFGGFTHRVAGKKPDAGISGAVQR